MVNRATTIFREVLASLPEQRWRDGMTVDWGEKGGRARARHAAALMGIEFKENCTSCDSDLFLLMVQTVKGADAAMEDIRNQRSRYE